MIFEKLEKVRKKQKKSILTWSQKKYSLLPDAGKEGLDDRRGHKGDDLAELELADEVEEHGEEDRGEGGGEDGGGPHLVLERVVRVLGVPTFFLTFIRTFG